MSKETSVDPLARVNIREIALAAIKRARVAGESQEMLARWISEDVHAAIACSPSPA